MYSDLSAIILEFYTVHASVRALFTFQHSDSTFTVRHHCTDRMKFRGKRGWLQFKPENDIYLL